VGLVALIRFLPGALVAPFAGIVIDRVSRRAVMFASSLVATFVLAGVAAAAALHAPTPVVFAFPALYAIAVCGYPPAHSALTPSLAETPQQLSASNVTHSATENGGALAAALVAGVLLAVSSPSVVFGVAAAAAALVVIMVFGVQKDSRPSYEIEEDEV